MMFWLILAATASDARPATTQNAPPTAVVAEARATVRVLHAVKIDFHSPKDLPPAHEASVVSNGTRQRVRLIEFE